MLCVRGTSPSRCCRYSKSIRSRVTRIDPLFSVFSSRHITLFSSFLIDRGEPIVRGRKKQLIALVRQGEGVFGISFPLLMAFCPFSPRPTLFLCIALSPSFALIVAKERKNKHVLYSRYTLSTARKVDILAKKTNTPNGTEVRNCVQDRLFPTEKNQYPPN